MRRLNCSAPPPGSPGVRWKMGVIKKGGALQNEVKKGGALQNEGIIVINQGGDRKKYNDKKIGTAPQKVMFPGGARGGGEMGQNNFTDS